MRNLYLNTRRIGLGNALHLLPLIRTLRAEWPGVKIWISDENTWGMRDFFRSWPGIDGILPDAPALDAVLVPLYSRPAAGELIRLRFRYPRIPFVFHSHTSVPRRSQLAFALFARRVNFVDETHEIDANLALASALGARALVKKNDLALPGVPVGKFGLHPGEYIAVQPIVSNSGLTPKKWPAEHWRDLLARLLDAGETVVLLGDASESFSLQPGPGKGRVFNLMGRTSLTDLAAIVKSAKRVIAADSGIAHLAAVQGAPTLVLWGPTSLTKNRPLGPGVKILNLSVSCAPCTGAPGLKGEAEALSTCSYGNKCMRDLSPDRVLHELRGSSTSESNMLK